MKSTWPMRELCVWDPTAPIFHLLTLGVGVEGKANFNVFGYQHVGISNGKLWCWGSETTPGPNANGFASQWNIGFRDFPLHICHSLVGSCHVWSQTLGIQAPTPPLISPHGWLVLYRKQIKNRATHWMASILNTSRHVLPSGSEQHEVLLFGSI